MSISDRIKQKANDIRTKIYGEEVRESLASGIEEMSKEVQDTIGRQYHVEGQFQNVIENTTDKDVISAPELIAARNGEANLKARLDKEKTEVAAQLAQKATQDEVSRKRDKSVPIGLNDADSELLTAIQGGTPVEVLSIPRDFSVTAEKTDFLKRKNYFNKDSPDNVMGKYVNSYYGESDGEQYMYSHLIPVKSGDEVSIVSSFRVTNRGVYADKNGNIILDNITTSDVAQSDGYYTFTVLDDVNIAYFRFNDFKSKYGKSMVIINDTFDLNVFYPYETAELKTNIKLGENQASQVEEIMANKPLSPKQSNEVDSIIYESLFKTVNHFNKDSTDNVTGFYMEPSGPVEHDILMYSHLIAVKGGDSVSIKTSYGYAFRGVFVDSVGNILSSIMRDDDNVTNYEGYYTVIVPNNDDIVYLRFNDFIASYADTMVAINQNLDINNYEPYGVRKLQESIIAENGSSNSLFGKTALFNGDSICYGHGYTGGYPKIIGENNGMNVVNYAVAGGTIASETHYPDRPRHWVGADIANMQSDADYIILEGGINDYYQNVPIGEISPDYISTLDTTTFCGAFEDMLKQSVLKWKGKKIGFVITHKINATYYPYGSQVAGNFEVYREKIIEMCEKWSIPYLDLFNLSGLNTNLQEIKDLYTSNGDGTHPNEQGYRLFYVPKIESWMKTL